MKLRRTAQSLIRLSQIKPHLTEVTSVMLFCGIYVANDGTLVLDYDRFTYDKHTKQGLSHPHKA